jgi:hypothetical protein
MFSRHITATGAALAVAIGAVAAPTTWARTDSAPSPGAMGAGATAVSSQSIIPTKPSPGARGAGATAVSSQSLLPGHYRAGEQFGGPSGSPTLSVVHVTHASGFDWGDAGIGAGSVALLAMAGVGSVLLVARRRRDHAGTPSQPLAG